MAQAYRIRDLWAEEGFAYADGEGRWPKRTGFATGPAASMVFHRHAPYNPFLGVIRYHSRVCSSITKLRRAGGFIEVARISTLSAIWKLTECWTPPGSPKACARDARVPVS